MGRKAIGARGSPVGDYRWDLPCHRDMTGAQIRCKIISGKLVRLIVSRLGWDCMVDE